MRKLFALAAALAVLLLWTPVYGSQNTDAQDEKSGTVFFKDTVINHAVNGDQVQVAGNVDIRESVNGNVVVVMGDVTISAPVTGDVVVVFGTVRLAPGAQVQGNIVTVVGNDELPGTVYGNVVTIAGNTGIQSRIGGNVISLLGAMSLEKGTDIDGDVFCLGSCHKSSGARIIGREVSVDLGTFDFQKAAGSAGPVYLLLTGVFSIFVLLGGLILSTIASRWISGTAANLEGNFWRKAGIGFLVLIGCILVQLVLFISIIAPVAFLLLLMAASILVCQYIGGKLCRQLHIFCSPVLQFACGFIAVTLLKLLLIICSILTGWSLPAAVYLLLVLFISSLGIGGIVDRKSLPPKAAGAGGT